jgi:hypothetical protein
MLFKIKIAVAAVAIAFALPASTTTQVFGDNGGALRSAQYCMPENEFPLEKNNVYC